jgi:hypothetical protein
MFTPIINRGEAIGEVHDFKYLGSTVATFRDLEKELNHYWELTTGKFVQFQPIWSIAKFCYGPIWFFTRPYIPSTLLYECESWALTQAQARKFNAIHMGFLHKLFRAKWWQKLSNVKVAARCDIEQIPTMLSKTRMRCMGQMVRMGIVGSPRKYFSKGLARAGVKGRGRPKQKVAMLYE